MTQGRFVRGESGGHARVRCREESRAELLGRMWTLFGAPDHLVERGFAYRLRDRETDRSFTVYAGPTGPAYGGPVFDPELLDPVLDAFDRLLDTTPLADCKLELPTDCGHDEIGVENGVAFDRPVAG